MNNAQFANEINNRINNLQNSLKEKEIDGALIIDRVNVYYFSGCGQNCHLYIPCEGNPVLMVKKVYDKAVEESPLEDIIAIKSIKEIPGILKNRDITYHKIAMELDVLPTNIYFYYKKVFNETDIVDISNIIKKIRMIKSDYELSLIRQSGKKHHELFNYIPTVLRNGMTDRELAGYIEGYARKLGHHGYTRFRGFNIEFFLGHTLVGNTGAVPSPYEVMAVVGEGSHPTFPQGVSGSIVEEGKPIYVDYVGNYTGYLVDQTRIFATGKLSDKLENAMDVSIEIIKMVEDEMIEGANGREIYEKSVKIAAEAGLLENYMGYPQGVPFIGHGIGLEVNEWPVIAKDSDIELKKNMVIAVEPKFIFPKWGAVGVENSYIITEDKPERLTITDNQIKYICQGT
jgi:Xaa-Pro dipeptidase